MLLYGPTARQGHSGNYPDVTLTVYLRWSLLLNSAFLIRQSDATPPFYYYGVLRVTQVFYSLAPMRPTRRCVKVTKRLLYRLILGTLQVNPLNLND